MIREIPDIIQELPLNVITRMKIERGYIKTAKCINKILGRKNNFSSSYYPLVRNNRFYGDELLLRKYSGMKKDLHAIIEHGLYFGNNKAKVGYNFEWEIGNILTLGDYRKKLINDVYPEYYCETIGPLIHYADIDREYQNGIERKLKNNERALLFFPVHGNELFSPIYNARNTVNCIMKIANEKDCYNVIICVYYDSKNIYQNICDELNTDRIVVTTCGNRYDDNFLCRQKALIEMADLTMSNSLGTHIGYCIYMGKPHILLPQEFSYKGNKEQLKRDFGDSNRSSNWKSDYEQEINMFQNIFSPEYNEITDDQLETCNYYWGIDKIKTPKEIREIYQKCYDNAQTFKRR